MEKCLADCDHHGTFANIRQEAGAMVDGSVRFDDSKVLSIIERLLLK